MKKLIKCLNESMCQEESIDEIPEWAVPHIVGHIKDLEDGTYKAKYYAHMFELEDGRRYYCPIGVLRSGELTPWEQLDVKGIKITPSNVNNNHS